MMKTFHVLNTTPVKALTILVSTILLFATPLLPSVVTRGGDSGGVGWDAAHGLSDVSLTLPSLQEVRLARARTHSSTSDTYD